MQNKYEFKQKIRKAKPNYTFQGSHDSMRTNSIEHKSNIDENRVILDKASKG